MEALYLRPHKSIQHPVEEREYLKKYDKLWSSSVKPSGLVVLEALKECSRYKDLVTGRRIHRSIVENGGKQLNFNISSTLLDMYIKCRSMEEARGIFESMTYRNVVNWNCIISGYAEDNGKLALEFYTRMQYECVPDHMTFLAALKACAFLAAKEQGTMVNGNMFKIESLKKVKAIHTDATAKRELHNYVANMLVDTYAKCGSMEYARQVFENMQRDVVSWNCIISGYVERTPETALEFYARMLQEGLTPHCVTLLAALKACVNTIKNNPNPSLSRCLLRGKQIHSQATFTGDDHDIYVRTALLDMYAKCGCLQEARNLFEGMNSPSIVSWTAMIAGCVECGEAQLALDFFERMQKDGRCIPNRVTFLAVFKAYAVLAGKEERKPVKLGILAKARELHRQAGESHEQHMFCSNALLDMYAKCGSMRDAEEVFERIPCPDLVSWSCMILGYAENGEPELGLGFYYRMHKVPGLRPDAAAFVAALVACASLAEKEENVPVRIESLEKGKAIHLHVRESGEEQHTHVLTALIDMYGKCGSLVDAQEVFDGVKVCRPAVWNSLISAYAGNQGHERVALELFWRMRQVQVPLEATTYVSVFKACGVLGFLETGRALEDEIHPDLYNSLLMCSLVDFYCKCGSMEDALRVFKKAPRLRSISMWNALLDGYSRTGNHGSVFKVFHEMVDVEKVTPDSVTFLTVLTSCSHTGYVERANEIFSEMTQIYGVVPDVKHYTCMVDLLGRANMLEEAVSIIEGMPVRADGVLWMALLGGAKKWNNLCVGKLAFDSLLPEERLSAAYVAMANIYRQP